MRRSSRAFQSVCVPGLLLCLTLAAPANNSHNFGGDYKILHVTQQGNSVEVKVSLRVINNSGTDVKDSTISLTSSLVSHPPGQESDWEKAETPIKIDILHFNEHKVVPPLEATFTLPSREYEQWQKTGRANFVIDYQDASGKQRHERIDLAPGR